MKNYMRSAAIKLLSYFYPAVSFNNKEYPLKRLLIWAIKQQFSIHRHIPWPVHPTTQIIDYKKITVGNHAPGYSMCCFIDARNGIVFGKNVRIGPKVSIISMDHDLYQYDKYITEKSIHIGSDSLLCNGCTILPGVALGEHTIVAAGAVVTKSFPEGNQILAGVPAVMIRKLSPYTIE